MATIDKLDISVYNLYAVRTRMIEQINQQLHLEADASIPPQTAVINTYAKLSEIDLLLGILPMHSPWAYFFPPKQFKFLRRSPFSFSRVAPTLGSLDEREEDEEGEDGEKKEGMMKKLMSVRCNSPEEQKEKDKILACFRQISKLNNWLGFIVGRVGQFLQG